MWQVSGRSNITDFEEVVRLDTKLYSGMDIWTGHPHSSSNGCGCSETRRFDVKKEVLMVIDMHTHILPAYG